jgi:hypothetical protein
MLNYNLNIITVKNTDHYFDYRPLFWWNYDNRSVASDNINLLSAASGSFTITGPLTNAVQITTPTNEFFVGTENEPYTASISGSGQWPITGSTTMSLFIAGVNQNEFCSIYNFYEAVSGSQLDGTLATASGSIISNQFTGSRTQNYYVTGSIVHTKGNVYNPAVNWKGVSPFVNGFLPLAEMTSSIQIVKDTNVIVLPNTFYITGSQTGTLSGSFNYEYAIGVTASISSSWNNLYDTASFPYLLNYKPTMSLNMPEISLNISSSLKSSLLTGSFYATTNTPYTVTGSAGMYVVPAFSASIVVVGGGGGGAAGGGGAGLSIFGAGGAGGAGGVYKFDSVIQPFSIYNVNSVGTFGSGGLNQTSGSPAPGFATSASLGQNGTLSSLTYFVDNKRTATLIASGGFGAGQEQNSSPTQSRFGGSSGNGFNNGSGSGGGGTISPGGNGNYNNYPYAVGGTYLGGMGGAGQSQMGTLDPNIPQYATTAPTFSLPTPNTDVTFTWPGIAGYTSNNENNPTAIAATAFGGGGAGAGDSLVTSGQGSRGANGVIIVAYYGEPKLVITKGYTVYNSGSNYTQHYITGSGATFYYEPTASFVP